MNEGTGIEHVTNPLSLFRFLHVIAQGYCHGKGIQSCHGDPWCRLVQQRQPASVPIVSFSQGSRQLFRCKISARVRYRDEVLLLDLTCFNLDIIFSPVKDSKSPISLPTP